MNAADWNAADWNVLQAAAVVAAVCVLAAGIMVGLGRRAARGLIGPRRLTLELDADDFDAVQAAIDSFLARPRWSRHDDDVDRNKPGSVVAEICREWARAQERKGRR